MKENRSKEVAEIERITKFSHKQVSVTLQLLIDEDCTVPFIARYRKDQTMGLDEVGIRLVEKSFEEITEREKRREFILETLKSQKILTPKLEGLILSAKNLRELEDIYAPYKSKKKTKAQVAKDNGLEPLSEHFLNSSKTPDQDHDWIVSTFVEGNEKVESLEKALEGAMDIIIESFSHHPESKEKIRHFYWKNSILQSEKRKDAEKVKDHLKYKDFFEFTEKLESLKTAKSSHRYLAIRRGMQKKILKVEVSAQHEFSQKILEEAFFPKDKKLGYRNELAAASEKATKLYIYPSIDTEVKTELKKFSDIAAVEVFNTNLKNLLLSPYLGAKAVMGVDPGIVSGCKIVIVGSTGELIDDFVIFPHPPKQKKAEAFALIQKALEKHKIEYIAIGNGTFGRETLAFFQENIPPVKSGEIKATMISESGASVYSASDIAREEFPKKDVTVRGSVSIARRFQDPLAELVKIDPKSIGVGQYQHDVSQSFLKKSLGSVVESCVNFVGVDLNTASAPLLSFVSGIGPVMAKNIVQYRNSKGGFKNRKELFNVPRFSDKVFTQSAGFLRIYSGEQPLDSTFIHPEAYESIIEWIVAHKKTVKELVGNSELIGSLENDRELKTKLGDFTFKDIVKSLKTPSQDPRTTFKSVDFDKSLKVIKDLKVGTWYPGVVSNITNFGAFVDVGLKETGLVHISELSDQFVKNPLDHIKVGQELRVKVIDVDFDRKRISLSARTGEKPPAHTEVKRHHKKAERKSTPARGEKPQKSREKPARALKSNPFGALKDFKIKT
ncbi:MAG: S1 RNA-binding domain-containing protein [Bacteriovoracaceae bacterium]|jgi:protein Tex|nr:S1 RNA-binding domain-containing protein [Bacteriovoracaceae bacterium]